MFKLWYLIGGNFTFIDNESHFSSHQVLWQKWPVTLTEASRVLFFYTVNWHTHLLNGHWTTSRSSLGKDVRPRSSKCCRKSQPLALFLFYYRILYPLLFTHWKPFLNDQNFCIILYLKPISENRAQIKFSIVKIGIFWWFLHQYNKWPLITILHLFRIQLDFFYVWNL